MLNEQILIGALIVLLCATGLWHDRWFLENTRKGQRLIRWFGEGKALWVLRAFLGGGVVFGILLAVGIIRPVQW